MRTGARVHGGVGGIPVPLLQESQAGINPSRPALQIATSPLIQVHGKLVAQGSKEAWDISCLPPGVFWGGWGT